MGNPGEKEDGSADIYKNPLDLSDDQIGVPGNTRRIYDIIITPIDNLNAALIGNRHLITLLGVFAALTAYIRSLQGSTGFENEVLINFFTTGGFLIVVLFTLVIFAQLGKSVKASESALLSRENIGIAAFGYLLFVLVGILISFISTFSKVWLFIYITGIYPFSAIVMALIYIFVKYISNQIGEEIGRSWVMVSIVFYLIIMLLGIIFVARGYLISTENLSVDIGIPPSQIVGMYISFTVVVVTLSSMILIVLQTLRVGGRLAFSRVLGSG